MSFIRVVAIDFDGTVTAGSALSGEVVDTFSPQSTSDTSDPHDRADMSSQFEG